MQMDDKDRVQPVPLLSSPSGYYGEAILQFVRSPLSAALSMHDETDEENGPRSHFDGLRLVEDHHQWNLEAHLPYPYGDWDCWLPFASVRCPDASHSPISFVPSNELEPLSDELKQARKRYQELVDRDRRFTQSIAFQLKPGLVASYPDLAPSDTAPRQLHGPGRFDFGSWLSENRQMLIRLQRSQVPDLYASLAKCVAESARKQSIGDPLAIRALVQGYSEAIEFVARLLKLHWYVGHSDWTDTIADLDGAFPRTRAPSEAWIGAAVYGSSLSGDKRMLMALSRSWMLPIVYERLCALRDEHDSCLVFSPVWPPEEHSSWESLVALDEWWTGRKTLRAYTPIPVPRDMLLAIIPKGTATGQDIEGSVGQTLWDVALDMFHNQCDALSEAEESWDYEQSLIRLNWDRTDQFSHRILTQRHDWAFPMVGQNLTLEDLLERDRLGWAMRDWEVETEGPSAWRRCVLNAIFEDAYGPQLIAEQVERLAVRELYDVFGANGLRTEVRSLSDQCELLLRTFVGKALCHWFGNTWYVDCVPEKVRKSTEDMAKCKSKKIESVSDFTQHLMLLDCDRILKHDRTWAEFQRILSQSGFERPSKTSFKVIQDWSRKIRNPSAHPESGNQLTQRHVEELKTIRQQVVKWMFLLDYEIQQAKTAADDTSECSGEQDGDLPLF